MNKYSKHFCLALLMAVGVPFLLPHMHDRYFYPADALSLALAFAMPALFPVAPLVEFASFLGYYAYLSFYFSPQGGHYLLPMSKGSYALLAALALTGLAFALSVTGQRRNGKKKSSGSAARRG